VIAPDSSSLMTAHTYVPTEPKQTLLAHVLVGEPDSTSPEPALVFLLRMFVIADCATSIAPGCVNDFTQKKFNAQITSKSTGASGMEVYFDEGVAIRP
jgi:hypothetical protein